MLDKSKPSPAGRVPDQRPSRQPKDQHQRIRRRGFKTRLPTFGEEIPTGTGGRTTGQGYTGADSIRQEFTGYERDTETDLDYAQARYYKSQHGRFTGVDPLLESAQPSLPQTWNRYAYCLNNPQTQLTLRE
ncbi:MAG: hypothetical protein IPK58_07440 [Acidobacteria bacterium]|nr:hypothetical protein [Acidobacteriota bacterium]